MRMFQPKPRRRKKVRPNPFPKTRGIGIYYRDPRIRPVRQRTAVDLALEEAARQQQAAIRESRRIQAKAVETIVEAAKDALQVWREATEHNDQRLVNFPGWSTSAFCHLPVDEDIARAFATEIVRYRAKFERPLTLEEMDAVIAQHFRNERVCSTEQIVIEATGAVRRIAQKCINPDGIALQSLVNRLRQRASRAKQLNNDLDTALAFACEHVARLVGLVRPEVAPGSNQVPQQSRDRESRAQ